MSKVGLVLEGGAMRGIYTAGVTDFLMEKEIEFPYIIGVSAGVGSLVSYVTNQLGRSKQVIAHENQQSYFGLKQLLKNRRLLNLDMVITDYADNVFPLDFDALFSTDIEYECVITNCVTGQAEYSPFRNREMAINNSKASCSVPFICDPIEMNGNFYLDGSLSNGVPFERAFERGCDKVVVVMTKPADVDPTDYRKMKLVIDGMYKRKFPALCETMMNRKDDYMKQMEEMQKYIDAGKLFVVRPQANIIGHFEDDYDKLNECYQNGYDDMEAMFDDLLHFIVSD